jgi:hypothetical protein
LEPQFVTGSVDGLLAAVPTVRIELSGKPLAEVTECVFPAKELRLEDEFTSP